MLLPNRKKNYPLYETTHFRDFREMVENVSARFPDKVAFRYKRKPNDPETAFITFAQTRDQVRAIATEMHDLGIEGKRVALIGAASVEWFLSYFSLMIAEAVTVPVDKELPVPDMASILNTSECEYVFFGPSAEKKIDEVRALVPSLKGFIEFGEPCQFAKSYDSLVQAGKEKLEDGERYYFDHEIHTEKLSSIVFTSGTTGQGKGVMLSMKNICSDMVQGMYNFLVYPRTMFVLPPHHTFGSTVNLIGHYAQGCEIYISSGIRYVPAEIKEFKPDHLILVPLFVETFYKKVMATVEKSGKLEKLQKGIKLSNALLKIGIDLRPKLFKDILDSFGGNLHMIICGGATLNQKIIDFFESIGIVILNGYGITECAPLISCNRNECRKTGSVGLPIRGGEVRILDPNENGEGEICYKGPNVMLGYYRNETATKAVFTEDGYFRTGDLGKVVTEGKDQWIYITGRSKNLIIFSNGKNVYPEEIETDIQGIYGVGEVVVYAGESKSDPSKEVIVAEIYPDAEALKLRGIENAERYFEEEVKKINEKNVSYKNIGKVKIRTEEFPKNTSKKIVRFKIDKSID